MCVAAAGVCAGARAHPAGAQEPVVVEAVVRVDLQRGPSAVLPALAADSVLLLPVAQVFEMAEIGVDESREGRYLAAVLEPADIPIRFQTDSGRLVVGDSVVPLDSLDALWESGDLFVSVATLGRALGVVGRVDWEELAVVFGNTGGLPVVRRARRERQRAIALRPRPAPPRATPARVRETVADGAVLEWSVTSATDAPIDNSSVDLGLGAKLFGGSIEIRHQLNRVSGLTRATTRASWERAWPEQRWVRQVRAGDVSSGGRRSRFVRGIVVTNEPFIRASEFDIEEVVGRLPPGWEVELYDSRGLLDFGEVDPLGDFRVALPLRYGSNPFDMVLYGPRGQVVSRRRTIRVPFSRLPERELEYSISGGQCRFDPCTGSVMADLRYGLSSKVTAEGGSDIYFREAGGDLFQPYAIVSAAPIPALSVTGEVVVNGFLRARTEFEPTPDFRLDFAHTEFDADGATFTGALLESRRTEGMLFWRPDELPGALYLQVSGLFASGPVMNRSSQRISVTGRFGNLRQSLNLRRNRVGRPGLIPMTQTLVDLDSDLVLRARSEWLRATTVRGGITFDVSRGISAIRAGAGRRVGRAVRLELGLGWLKDMGGLALDIGFNTVLPGPRFGSRNRFTTGAGSDGVQFIDGSILWDRSAQQVRWGDGRDLGRAGVTGTLFLDTNGNGARDPGEQGIPGHPVRVGGWTELTDEAGRFSAWNLFPFEPSYIEVDSLAFDNPFLVLPTRVVEVIPTPNSFQSVEIPVVMGAEISGGVVMDGQGLPGVQVLLRTPLVGLLLLGTGAAPALAQAGSIEANARVAPVAPLVVTPITDLEFGTVSAGTNTTVQPFDAGAGRMQVSSEPFFDLILTFTLPTTLDGAGGSIPITFGPASTALQEGDVPVIVGTFDPSAPINFSPTTASGFLQVDIGGTVSPPVGAAGGEYTNTITLTVEYQ